MRILEMHASLKEVKRSAGRSAVAAAAYRSGACFKDERTGIIYDFRRKGGVEHERIYLPDNAPHWARDRAKLGYTQHRYQTRHRNYDIVSMSV